MPRLSRIAQLTVFGLGLVGLTGGALGANALSANGASIVLPSVLPTLHDDGKLDNRSSDSDDIGSRLGVTDGQLDFFSFRSNANAGFAPMLHGGIGGKGLQIQLKW